MSSTVFHGPIEPSYKGRNPLVVLREQTRIEHVAIEQALDLCSPTLTRAMYERTLERFYGFYKPIERKFREVFRLDECDLYLDSREKTSLLAEDLRLLRSAPEGLPLCVHLPAMEGLSSALGCMYVLEGASLGGQIISRHLRARLGITPENGGRFFHGYGEQTGERWKAFGALLRARVTTSGDENRAVEAATATFRALRRWCAAEETP